MRPIAPLTFVLLVSLLPITMVAQDVEQTLQDLKDRIENPLSFGGGIGIQLQTYSTNLPVSRSAPFDGTIQANMRIRTFGVETPLDFIYSSGGTAFNVTLPSFGFAGISPSYRDYTLHLGDRSVTLGKYSFSNHSFRGVGGEVNKERWYTRMFYGRLQRAQATDFKGFQNIDPLFKRMGYGVLIGGQPNNDGKVEVSLFKAWDDPSSLGVISDTSLILDPSENLILSTLIEQNLFKKIKVSFNFSSSGYTGDRTLSKSETDTNKRSLLGILETNGSTRWKNALETRLSYLSKFATIDLNYERIDPGYRTMGALFFQDDQENITAGITSQFFNNVLSLVGQGGLQNNNLDGNRSEKYRRWIGSMQANVRVSEKVNATLGYSNFSSVNRQVRILDPGSPNRLTELALTNVNVNGCIQYQAGKYDQILGNFSYQNNQTITRDENISETTNDIKNLMIMYRKDWPENTLSMGFQTFVNQLNMNVVEQRQLGATLQFTKPFLKEKLKASASLSYLNNRQIELVLATAKTGNLWQFRTMLHYEMSMGQRLSLDGSFLTNRGNNITSFGESRIRLNYQVSIENLKKA